MDGFPTHPDYRRCGLVLNDIDLKHLGWLKLLCFERWPCVQLLRRLKPS